MTGLSLTVRVALMILAFSMIEAPASGQDSRTWKDASGKFSIKAKFVSNDNGKLTLARDDGEEIEIELKNLSASDQKYVADLEKESTNPFKSAKADPFKAKKAATGRGTATSEARAVNADWSDARLVAMAPEKGDWEVVVDTNPDLPALKFRAAGIPAKSNFFERLKGLVLSSDGKHAILGYTTDEPRPLGVTRLVQVDLEKGRSVGSGSSPGLMAPLGLSEDGTRVLMKRDEFGFGNNDRVEVWTVSASGLSKGVAFFPYGDTKGIDRDVKWGGWVGQNRAFTVSHKGKLALWDLGSAKALYTMGIQEGSLPALSPDRKLLAFTTGKEVGILDVESGTVRGLKATGNTPFATLAFSPSSKKFAVAAMDKLWAYDTATGELQTEMLLTGIAVNGEAQWTDEEHILIGHQFLLDLPNQVKLWQYQGAERASQVGLTTLFLMENGNQGAGSLVAAQLPQPSVKAALAKAIADPGFFVLKPGAAVKVVTNDVADPSRKASVADALTAKLSAIGATADPNAVLQLVASTELGKQREITYRTMGRGFGVQTYKVQEYISRVKFVYQGKTAWESSSYNIPHIVSLRNGQTMESYLKEQEKPNYDYFAKVELPKLLTRPTGTPTLGTSPVTPMGLR